MKEMSDKESLLLRNLNDAGCDAQTIEQFIHLQSEGKTQQQLRLLSRHRRLLLQKVHDNQAKVDCLDYLIYTMKSKSAKIDK